MERTHGQHAPAAHDAHGAHDGHAHPGPRTYVKVAAILTLITLIEVAIFYIPFIANILPLLITSFIVLSAIKFALVVMYFMHLKFDDVFFTRTFGFALLIALTIATAFIALFHGIYF